MILFSLGKNLPSGWETRRVRFGVSDVVRSETGGRSSSDKSGDGARVVVTIGRSDWLSRVCRKLYWRVNPDASLS